jgi:MATE family multidrug resistance protein
MVDTGVVGQMGEAAPIGAVGIGAIIIAAVYWIFGFLRMGTVGLTSQAIGRGDEVETDVLLTRALMFGIAAGCVLILLQIPIIYAAFLVSPASAEVETLARDYIQIRIFSAPAAIGLYAITGWLIAAERTRAVLVIQLWTNGLNIILDFWFVLSLGWGVEGVAFATFLAEWSGFALGLWFCRHAFWRPHWNIWPRVFDAARLKQMGAVNTDIMIRSILLETIFVSFMFFGSDFGDVPLAANQVLLQFLFITAYALDGFAFAAETLVGQAVGAKNRPALRRGALLTSGWGAIVVGSLGIAFAIFGGAIIDIMTTAPDVRIEAREYLIYMVAAPFVGVAAWMFDGIYIGATRTRDMRNMMAISTVVYFIAIFSLMPIFGNHGLWMSLLISFIVRGITLGIRYPKLEAMADA